MAFDSLLEGAVDVYVHATPDLIPRQSDDFGLARAARTAGIRAMVHRSHFSSTAERSRLVSDATGFQMLGAILTNESAGGLSPSVVELALRMGAVWVGLPTLGGHTFQPKMRIMSPEIRSVSPEISLLDGDGRLCSAVVDIILLVKQHDAVLNLGYASFEECLAAARAAHDVGVERVTLTGAVNSMLLTIEQVDELMAFPNVHLEVTASTMYRPDGPGGILPEKVAEVIRRYGLERCFLSSDGNSVGALPQPELLAWSCGALIGLGFSDAELRTLVQVNPARLIRLD
jgi:hypothetical protein